MDIGNDLMMKSSRRKIRQARARLLGWTRREWQKFGWLAIFYMLRSLMRRRDGQIKKGAAAPRNQRWRRGATGIIVCRTRV
jgi:hypothetical protein